MVKTNCSFSDKFLVFKVFSSDLFVCLLEFRNIAKQNFQTSGFKLVVLSFSQYASKDVYHVTGQKKNCGGG